MIEDQRGTLMYLARVQSKDDNKVSRASDISTINILTNLILKPTMNQIII